MPGTGIEPVRSFREPGILSQSGPVFVLFISLNLRLLEEQVGGDQNATLLGGLGLLVERSRILLRTLGPFVPSKNCPQHTGEQLLD